MEIINNNNGILLKYAENFDLSHTFDCGQCFRFQKYNEKYTGTVNNSVIELSQAKNEILIKNITIRDFQNFWYEYFDLKTDYKKIGENLSHIHPILKKAYNECSGIRILKQDPWETLCSFIISQNNNIPRIKKIIHVLCYLFGNKIGNEFSFPSAHVISKLNIKDLEPIKSGFRSKYILDAAQKVSSCEIDLKNIEKSNSIDAKNKLMKIHGVGPKIADCVLLYGFHRLDAFPMDIWMKRIMNKFFKNESPEIFGKYAGIAQQYLYHYSRTHPYILD